MEDDEVGAGPPPAPNLQAAVQAEQARLVQVEADNEAHNQRIAEWQAMEQESPEFVQEWRQTFAQSAQRMGIEASWPAVMQYAEDAGVPGIRSEPEAISFLAQLQHRADTGVTSPEDVAFLDSIGRSRARNQTHDAAGATQTPPGLSPGYVESMVRQSGTGNGISPGYVESLERTQNWDRRMSPEDQGVLPSLTAEDGIQNPVSLDRYSYETPQAPAPAPTATALDRAVVPRRGSRQEEEEFISGT